MTDAQTVAGALRDHLALALPDIPAYRGNAPEGLLAPLLVIFDGLATATRTDLGNQIVLDETVQIDLYTMTGQSLTLADEVHAALHNARLWLPTSTFHSRVMVSERATIIDDTDDRAVTRIAFTATVTRRINSINDPNQPLPPRQPAPLALAIHEAKTTDVHGIADTAALETLTGAQAKADAALTAAEDYTDAAIAALPEIPANIESVEGAQAKADAALAAAEDYTDAAIAALPEIPANIETVEGAQAKADAALAAAEDYADAAVTAHTVAADPHGDRAYADGAFIPLAQRAVPNGVATLGVDGKIPTEQLSALTTTEVFTVSSEAQMVLLVAQPGDVARRTDTATTYILAAAPASVASNWVIFLTPPDAVLSVDGRIGSIDLSDRYDPLGAATAALASANAYTDAAEAEAISVSEGYTDAALLAIADELVPAGGAEGQILGKASAADFDTTWIDNATANIEQYVKNATGTTLLKGQVVYVNGAQGDNPTIALADSDTEITSSKTFGFLKQTLLTGEHGYVVTEGLLEGLNTNGALDGDPIWLSGTPGGVLYGIANKPVAPQHLVSLGFVLRSQLVNGKIYVKVQNGYELEELHNVLITGTPADRQPLTYDTASGLWKNRALAINQIDTAGAEAGDAITFNGTAWTVQRSDTFGIVSNVPDIGSGNSASNIPTATGVLFSRASYSGLVSDLAVYGQGTQSATGTGLLALAVYSNNGLVGQAAAPMTLLAQTAALQTRASNFPINTLVKMALDTPVYVNKGDWLASLLIAPTPTAAFSAAQAQSAKDAAILGTGGNRRLATATSFPATATGTVAHTSSSIAIYGY